MNIKKSSDEQKQHLNISKYALDIIYHDATIFFPSESINLSGFINIIISNTYETSAASIEHLTDTKELELTACIPAGIKNTDRYSDIYRYKEKIRLTYYSQLEETIKQLTENNGNQINIRLNNDNYSLLTDTDFKEYKYYGATYRKQRRDETDYDYAIRRSNYARGKYLNALLEAYAHNPFNEREKLIFYDKYIIIEQALAQKKRPLLKISPLNNKNTYYIKPYSISMSEETRYYYLIGISKNKETGTEIPASIRLSRIDKIRPLSSESGTLTKEQKNEIITAIANKGLAYLIGDTVECTVKLTPNGYMLYNRLLHQRPNATNTLKQDDDYIMTFNCTELQIYNYFFKFGKEVTVISPETLKNKFIEQYDSASKNYI